MADELWLVARNEKALTDVAGELDTPSRAVAADLTSEADIANIRATLSAEDPASRSCERGRLRQVRRLADHLRCRGGFHDRPELPRAGGYDRATLPHGTGQPHHPGGSAAAFTPLPHMNVYAATKSFVLHYRAPFAGSCTARYHRHGAVPHRVKTG